jgi:hypothetical protein
VKPARATYFAGASDSSSPKVLAPKKPEQKRRAFWLKHLHQWHWVSAAACLIGMLLFALTGITLNHAAQIEAKPQVSTKQAQLPPDLLNRVAGTREALKKPLPDAIRTWLSKQLVLDVPATQAEWSADEIYLSLPRPGGDAWLSIDAHDGSVRYERTDRGWISYLNDLHKGRNAGTAWAWFIDVFAVACLIFCISGLVLLQFHANNRPATWPVVGVGLVIPLLLAILFIH